MQSGRRLYKSKSEKMIDGVCGGVALYFGLDPTLVRIVWVLLIFMGGVGIVLYLAGMILMPTEPAGAPSQKTSVSENSAKKVFGGLLIVVGALWILHNLGIHFWGFWWGISWETVLALLLIGFGLMFLFEKRNSSPSTKEESSDEVHGHASADENSPRDQTMANEKTKDRLMRSRTDNKILGVCGGIAAYAGIDSTLVRLLFVLGAFASFGLFFLGYIVLGIVVPKEPSPAIENPIVQPA
ncbi:MAG TPA: PspC domain-containing protein [Bacteroidota bacterium]